MRRIRGLLAAGALLTVLGACAPGTGTSGDDTGQSSAKKLTYVYFTDGPDEKATRGLIAEYEKKTGVKVDLQVVPYDSLEQKLQARLSGGNAPDVARLSGIDPFRDDLLNLDKFQKSTLDGQFIDGAKGYVTGKDGGLVAVPSDLTMNGPLINVDQFRKAGVPLPDEKKPWTWDQMVAAAAKVKKANKTQYSIAMDVSGHRFATMLSEYGVNYFSGDGKQVGFDPAKTTAAIKRFASLNASGAMPSDLWLQAGSKYKGANEIFLAKQVPVYISGNWQVSAFAESAKFNWAVAPNPCQARCGGYPGGKFMVGFKQSHHQKLAADFIAFMNSKHAQQTLAQQANFIPTRKDLLASGVQYPSRGKDMGVYLDEVKRTPTDTYPSSYSPAFAATADAVVAELSKVLAHKETPAQATTAIRTAAGKALKDAQ